VKLKLRPDTACASADDSALSSVEK